MAYGGHITDFSLAGLTSTIQFPYIALASLSLSINNYWSKVFSLMDGSYIHGLQFSTDGELLIAHTSSIASTIVVLDVITGNVLSARGYSSTGYYNYNAGIISLLISSGLPNSAHYAYVLSNLKTSTSCLGQQLFKFDPKSFSNLPIWSKKTSGSTIDNCGHLGLIFGRNE